MAQLEGYNKLTAELVNIVDANGYGANLEFKLPASLPVKEMPPVTFATPYTARWEGGFDHVRYLEKEVPAKAAADYRKIFEKAGFVRLGKFRNGHSAHAREKEPRLTLLLRVDPAAKEWRGGRAQGYYCNYQEPWKPGCAGGCGFSFSDNPEHTKMLTCVTGALWQIPAGAHSKKMLRSAGWRLVAELLGHEWWTNVQEVWRGDDDD